MSEPFPRCTVYAQVLSGGDLQSACRKNLARHRGAGFSIVHQRKRETMNRTSIMAALIALLFVPFVASPADAYHSRHSRNHVATHQHSYRHLARYRTDECILTNNGQRVCNITAISTAPA